MYAIRVVLQPDRWASRTAQQLCAVASERIRQDAQPGVEHVSLVASRHRVLAMTFVMAADLWEAEQLAASAWAEWLDRSWLDGWRLASCAADLALGVWAVQASIKPDGGMSGVG